MTLPRVTLSLVEADLDERLLVESARADVDAFAELYRRHVHRVHALAWRRLGNRQAAEDVTSATFERALQALPAFRWHDGGFGAWVLRIAANQVTDHLRRERRPWSPRGQRALSMLAAVPQESEEGVGGDDPGLRAALARLRPRYAEALTLRYLAGLEHTEAAAAMGCSASTFAVVLHRAAAALRTELEKEDRRVRT